MTPSPGTKRRNTSAISRRRCKTAASGVGIFIEAIRPLRRRQGSALACLISRISLVDNVGSPLAADNTAVLVTLLQRFQRIDNLHTHVPRRGRAPRKRAGPSPI